MDEQYYALRLWCPATPPFVSADRIYIASASEMQKAMDAMDDSECCQETVKAYKRYMSGDKTATHNIAYRDIPVLEKVDLICTSIILIGEHQWEHINSWGYPYEMKCDSAEIKRIVVKYDNQYLRCYKITFKNLYTELVEGEWQRLNHFFLGNHFLLDVQYPTDDDFTITTFLYETEGIYDTLEEANAIDKKDNIDFKFFCDEIFGDG